MSEPSLASVFQDHMVLQREIPVRVWGTADPGERMTVRFGDQAVETLADPSGDWRVTLEPLQPGPPRSLSIRGKQSLIEIIDVLVGEVWLCSGQSNMGWQLQMEENGDLEGLEAGRYPEIRLLYVGNAGSQVPGEAVQGTWRACSDKSAASFSAVGYYFGKRLHQVLGVPIGLIDTSWGGASGETWVDRQQLEQREAFAPFLNGWRELEESFDLAAAREQHRKGLEEWRVIAAEIEARGQRPPWYPQVFVNPMTAQHRPGNLYNGRIKPLLPFAIRGAIWYQGETNTVRADTYGELFQLLIESWREEWDLGEFPFYWVQLANHSPQMEGLGPGNWADLRAAQTAALHLSETGQAVAIDLGEGNDVHPRDKRTVGDRLARIALARTYGFDVAFQGPEVLSTQTREGAVLVKFSNTGEGLVPVGTDRLLGFQIAGADHTWLPAEAELVAPDTIRVWNPAVADPRAVRYAWEDNPQCNLYNSQRLPAAPFQSASGQIAD